MTTRRRLDHVDAMRPVKQLGVVSTHSLLFFAPVATLGVGGALMLLHVTREAFLFISACMLTYGYQELRWGSLGRYARRRAVAVGLPYLCWTAIYVVVTAPSAGWHGPTGGLEYFGKELITGYYQLYYLLVVMQFYVLFPFVLPRIRAMSTRAHLWVLGVSLVVQLLLMSLMHWEVTPSWMHGFWATREVTSYQLYLVAGMVAALHLDHVDAWVRQHWRLVLCSTVVAAGIAEAWLVVAQERAWSFLGAGSGPFQPIVVPFNIGAIASVYLLGAWLVSARRPARLQAMVRSGSDNSYTIYTAQLLVIMALGGLGWAHLENVVPWPVVTVATVAAVVPACVLLGGVLARTPLATALTGRARTSWATFLPARHPVGFPDRTATGVGGMPVG